MITAIEIENFKAIGERVRIEIKPLTLIFGPNSAGKSTILQALHFAREIFDLHNLDPYRTVSGGDAFDLGGFTNIVHNHDTQRRIRLRLEIDFLPRLPDYDADLVGVEEEDLDGWSDIEAMRAGCRSAWVEAEVHWNKTHHIPTVRAYTVGVNDHQIAKLRVPNEALDVEGERLPFCKVEINFEHPLLSGCVDPETGYHCKPFSEFGRLAAKLYAVAKDDKDMIWSIARHPREVPSALPVWGSVLSLPALKDLFDAGELGSADEQGERSWLTRKVLTQFIVGPGEVALRELRKLTYLGPIREMPSRSFAPPAEADKQRRATGLGAWDRLRDADQHFLDRVNGWMSRLRCGYTIRLKDYAEVDQRAVPSVDAVADDWAQFGELIRRQPFKRRVVLVPEGRSIEVLPNDVGIGISQLLPAIVLALDAKGSLTAIEQPELHLHPALQAEIADLFVESAVHDRNTFILETHSEHLVLRLQRLVREGRLRNSAVSIIYVSQHGKGMKAEALHLDDQGDFVDDWPGGFFPERLREL